MTPGDVVLTQLIQEDGQEKLRPALVLKIMPPFGDYLVCGISSKLRNFVPTLDEIIYEEDSDFSQSGLNHTSLIRVGWLFTAPLLSIEGELGKIDDKRLQRLLERLSRFLTDH